MPDSSVLSFVLTRLATDPPDEPTGTATLPLTDRPTAPPAVAGAPQTGPDRPTDPDLGPDHLAAVLRAAGHRLLTADGRLFTSNASLLTPALRVAIKTHKTALIALAEPWTIDPSVMRTSVISMPPSATVSLAEYLGVGSARTESSWRAQEPPSLEGIREIVLNFETNGLDWAHGDRPIGVTVGTLDGQLKRFLPFGFRDGNLSEDTVKRWAERELRGKRITNANTRFDIHMAREWGIDLEAQGNDVSDVMHYAALLDDHRKQFRLDVIAKDYLGGIEVPRVDERNMAYYTAADIASRAEYQVQLVAQLREVMWPKLDEEDLQRVRQLEDDVIYTVVEMEKNGALINLELLEQYSAEVTARYQELMLEIAHEAGFAFEHTATGWQRLFEYCNLPPSDSYAEEVISTYDHPLIQKAYYAGQLSSLNSKTFAAYKKLVGPDGLLRYDINQLRGYDGGTVSGRFSAGYVQQVPNYDNHSAVFDDRWYPRRLFIPRIGDYLEADAAQIEYRLFAHFAENKAIIEAYQKKPDLSFHKQTHAMMLVYKPDMLYTHQKSFNFAKMYGAKSIKLAFMLKMITGKEADDIKANHLWDDPRLRTIHEIEAAYKKMMPEGDFLLEKAAHLAKSSCDKYCKKHDEMHRQFKHRGYVKTLLGRRSRFPNNYKTYIGLNRVLQGTGADIMKAKLVELHRERKHTQFLMRLTVHDAVGGDAQEPDTLAKVSEILNHQSFPLRVPILWECKTGRNWGDVKKTENDWVRRPGDPASDRTQDPTRQ